MSLTFGATQTMQHTMQRTQRQRPEVRMQATRRLEQQREDFRELMQAEHSMAMKYQWEEKTARKAQHRHAQATMAKLVAEEDAKLEARREKLRELLQEEERLLIAEAAATVETTLDKQARMRERIKSLRENRESERLQVVEEKKRQLFLNNCDPVRQVQRNMAEAEVHRVRQQQLEEKAHHQRRKEAIDQLYDRLWLEDKEAKDAKAARDKAAAQARTQQQKEILQAQMAAVEEARHREMALREEEESLRRQAEALQAEEEGKLRQRKAEQQRRLKMEMDRHNRHATAIRQKEQEDELKRDAELLQQVLDAAQGEEQYQRDHKQQLQREMRLYRQYAEDIAAQRRAMEESVELFHQQEAQRAIDRLQAKLDREQAARDSLMQEVMAVRRQQIAGKLAGVQAERDEAAREYHELMLAMEAHDQAEAEAQEATRQRRLNHAEQLRQQAETNRRLREEEAARIEAETQRILQQERDYEAKVTRELQSLSLTGTGMGL